MKTNQCERIMRHLKDNKTITSAEAMREYGIYRLASRINDLRKSGVLIVTNFKTEKNRYGDSVSFAVYSFGKEA